MRTVVLFCFLMLLSVGITEAYNDYETLDIQFNVDNAMTIQPEGGSYYVDFVRANLSFFPREDYRQSVIGISTTPQSKGYPEEDMSFFWKEPSTNTLTYQVESAVQTQSSYKKVKKSIPFPIQGLSNDLYPYLQEDEIIDITPEIEQLATQLAEGETDLFSVVFAVADWTRTNIQYNLSTKTADASQSASWVLENREGVCDELTSLFIAQLRSLGIPAKFISGMSYTNAPYFSEPWGPHGWAEVYFPDVGWVPFDVTYGQLGWVDATHIKLKESMGPKQSSVHYEYRGRNFNLQTNPLNFETVILSTGEPLDTLVSLQASVYDAQVGFGSYNLIEARVRNLNNYYVVEDVILGKTTEITLVDRPLQTVLLAPNEEKTVYWIVKVNPDLNAGFIYTFPPTVYTSRNLTAETSFKASAGQGIYGYDAMKTIADRAVFDESHPYSSQVLFTCKAEENQIYYNETISIGCSLENQGGLFLEGVNVCFQEQCKRVDSNPKTKTTLTLQKRFEQLGLETIPVTAKSSDIVKTSYIVVNVLDEPGLYISNINVPEEVAFGESFDMEFTITKESQSFPQNIDIELDHDLIMQEWHFDELRTSQRFKLITTGSSLVLGQNQFFLTITFEDILGNTYKETRDFTITLLEPTFTEKIYIYMNMAGARIDRFINDEDEREEILSDERTWISVVIVILFLFVINTVLFIRRKAKGVEQHL